LPVDADNVFTSGALLDHIPLLIEQIGAYVAAAEREDISANTVVTEHARALGQLRHRQHASVHQVLREYDLLAEVLDQFLDAQTSALTRAPAAGECLEATRRIGRAVRHIMQTTVATFIGEYTDTIAGQAARLDLFNRAVSHELRNALGTIQFGAALLRNGSADADERAKAVAMLRRNTERASEILRSLETLRHSARVSGDTPSAQLIDLSELVGEVLRQLQDMAEVRGVVLRAAEDLPRLYIDTGRLELILINLIANAIKYSDPNKPERFVDITAAMRQDGCEIRVKDNGIGIPAEASGRIFDRFHRAHAHLDSALGVDGTGLGLAIVDECVRALSADIRVESSEGVGSVFVLTLPKKQPPVAEASGA
jgi:signal transduction histidine kinase